MVFISKTGEPFWNGATELAPEDDAFELVTSFGKAVALDICREELKGPVSPEKRGHWTEVKALIEAQPDGDDDEQLGLGKPDFDNRQISLFE